MTDQIDKLRTLNGELCAEINRQERRIRELERENVDLRIQLEGIKNFAVDEQRRGDALESLVRDMHKELANADGVFLMGYIEKRIRELGIEVNE